VLSNGWKWIPVYAGASEKAPALPERTPDEHGWRMSTDLIRAISKECDCDEYCPSDEGIELVLLAYEKVTGQRLALNGFGDV
jgi:hypothetical protein